MDNIAHLSLAIAITRIVHRVGLQHIEQLRSTNPLVLASKQFVGWKVAVEILLDIVRVTRVGTCRD